MNGMKLKPYNFKGVYVRDNRRDRQTKTNAKGQARPYTNVNKQWREAEKTKESVRPMRRWLKIKMEKNDTKIRTGRRWREKGSRTDFQSQVSFLKYKLVQASGLLPCELPNSLHVSTRLDKYINTHAGTCTCTHKCIVFLLNVFFLIDGHWQGRDLFCTWIQNRRATAGERGSPS